MEFLTQLWAPILLSAFLVFLASSLIHMVFKWHNSDYQQLPNEDEVRAAIARGNPVPGQYVTPWCMDMKDMARPEVQQKYISGPVGLFNIMKNGTPNMGPTLGQWFVFNLVAAVFVAYVASHALLPGTTYLRVFQLVGAVTFMTYGGATIPNSIWLGTPWKVTWKNLLDALIYGCVTAGAFGWLWPR
jgi:hypothetical protein